MKKMKFKLAIGMIAVSTALVGCKTDTQDNLEDIKLDTLEKKFSYGMGFQMGKMSKTQGIEYDISAYRAGMTDGLHSSEQRISDEDLKNVFQDYQKELQTKQQAKQEELGKTNIEAGKTFLAENAKKEGITTTASGLQYQVIEEGKGDKVKLEDNVKVHYHGTLIDGTVFDSSKDRGEPVTFPLKGVIKGWQEGLQLMSAGGKYKLFIPSELAYGDQGPAQIGPNATLIFDVEVIEINPKQAAPKAQPKAQPKAEKK